VVEKLTKVIKILTALLPGGEVTLKQSVFLSLVVLGSEGVKNKLFATWNVMHVPQ
jgi:hypothetical protein